MDSSNNFTISAWLLAAYIITAKPQFLLHLAKSVVGRAILIVLVFATALISPLAGAALGAAFVVIASDVTEGMKSSRKTTQTPDFDKIVSDLRQTHCKSKDGQTLFVDDQGNTLTLQEIQQKYPNIDFSGDACNPCDDACAFTVTETTDQITIETALQPTNTSTEPFVVTK